MSDYHYFYSGRKDGDVKMIIDHDTIEAYQVGLDQERLFLFFVKRCVSCLYCFFTIKWMESKGKWDKVGQVVDVIGNERKQLFQGKEYDYVFDVDLEDGQPLRKLPYRVTGRLEIHDEKRGESQEKDLCKRSMILL